MLIKCKNCAIIIFGVLAVLFGLLAIVAHFATMVNYEDDDNNIEPIYISSVSVSESNELLSDTLDSYNQYYDSENTIGKNMLITDIRDEICSHTLFNKSIMVDVEYELYDAYKDFSTTSIDVVCDTSVVCENDLMVCEMIKNMSGHEINDGLNYIIAMANNRDASLYNDELLMRCSDMEIILSNTLSTDTLAMCSEKCRDSGILITDAITYYRKYIKTLKKEYLEAAISKHIDAYIKFKSEYSNCFEDISFPDVDSGIGYNIANTDEYMTVCDLFLSQCGDIFSKPSVIVDRRSLGIKNSSNRNKNKSFLRDLEDPSESLNKLPYGSDKMIFYQSILPKLNMIYRCGMYFQRTIPPDGIDAGKSMKFGKSLLEVANLIRLSILNDNYNANIFNVMSQVLVDFNDIHVQVAKILSQSCKICALQDVMISDYNRPIK